MARKGGTPSVTFLDGGPFWDFDADTIQVAVEVSTLPGWRVAVVMRATDAREIVSLTMTPRDESVPEGGITRRALDRINLGLIVRATADEFEQGFERSGIHMSPALKRSVSRALTAQPRPGRRGFPLRYYAVIAAEYVERVVVAGETLDRFAKRHHLSTSRMRNILTTARDKGLLTSSPPGRAGGQLTDKALELLQEGMD